MLCLYISSFLLGAILDLSLAPFHFSIFGFISFSLFFIILQKSPSIKCASLSGFCFGLGYFLFGLYWIINAFIIVYNNHLAIALILGTLSLLILGTFLSIYWGLASLFTKYINKNIIANFFSFCVTMYIAEYLRGHCFTGFSWNLLSYAALPNIYFLQIAHYINIYSLVGVSCAIFTAPGLIIYPILQKAPLPLSNILINLMALLAILLFYYVGNSRLNSSIEKDSNLKVKLIQPNIEQTKKLNTNYIRENFFRLINLIKKDNNPSIDIIICPETAIDFFINNQDGAKYYIQKALYPNQLLIIGAPRIQDHKIYNSMLVLDHNANIINYSDKKYLVPFGEYLPYKNILRNLLPKAISDLNTFTAGKEKHTLQIKDKYALGLICYETNSYNAINYQGHEPNFIIDITNDAWYGYSTGPFQHFQQDRILTTMTQLPMVRISNNGISAVIDSYGRIKRKADLNKTANIISFLPN